MFQGWKHEFTVFISTVDPSPNETSHQGCFIDKPQVQYSTVDLSAPTKRTGSVNSSRTKEPEGEKGKSR